MTAKIYLIISYATIMHCLFVSRGSRVDFHGSRAQWVSFMYQRAHSKNMNAELICMTFDIHYACLERKKTKHVFVSIYLLVWDNENLNFHLTLQPVSYSRIILKVCISTMYHYCITNNQLLPNPTSWKIYLTFVKRESCNKLCAIDAYSLLNDIICKCQMDLTESMRFFMRAIHVVIPPMSLKTKNTSSSR